MKEKNPKAKEHVNCKGLNNPNTNVKTLKI